MGGFKGTSEGWQAPRNKPYPPAEGTRRGEAADSWDLGEGSPSRYCHLRGMKLLTQVPCQNRRELGRNTLTYFFCQFLPSVKPKQQPPGPCRPGDAVLGDRLAKAQAEKSKEWIWEGGSGEKGECRLTSRLWIIFYFKPNVLSES